MPILSIWFSRAKKPSPTVLRIFSVYISFLSDITGGVLHRVILCDYNGCIKGQCSFLVGFYRFDFLFL